MQEPRFQENDHVRIVRIYAADMSLENDLEDGLYDTYYGTLVGLHGIICSVEEKWRRDDSNFFVYEVEGPGLNLYFHEGELNLYAGG